MPLYRATATSLANLVAADGSSGGFIKDAQATAFGLSLLDDANAAAGLTTLGVSAFVQTLVDDTTARAFAATLGVPFVLGSTSGAVTRSSENGAGDATETAAATFAIPAGAMGANGWIRLTILASQTNSANAKTWRVRLGGVSGTQFYNLAATNQATLQTCIMIRNLNAQNSQVAFANQNAAIFGQTTNAHTTGAIDTSSAQDLVITNFWAGATSTESMVLQSAICEIFYKA